MKNNAVIIKTTSDFYLKMAKQSLGNRIAQADAILSQIHLPNQQLLTV